MVAFYLVMLLGVVTIFFLMAFIYKPLGKIIYRIFKDAKDAYEDNDGKEE